MGLIEVSVFFLFVLAVLSGDFDPVMKFYDLLYQPALSAYPRILGYTNLPRALELSVSSSWQIPECLFSLN